MMYLHHFLYSHTVFKSLSLFGFLCIILYERLPHIQAAELHQVPTPPPQCLAPTLIERLAPSHDICPVTPLHQDGLYIQSHASRVAELNETAFEKALYLVHSSGNGSYLAVLYHASWCPFSKNVRPAFDALSTMFPSIYHVAVEESSVRRSILLQFGIHSFPVLAMHNSTSRVRYYGPRALEILIFFYQNYTGLRASKGQPGQAEDSALARFISSAGKETKEVPHNSPAISSTKWLQDDLFLGLAMMFLSSRLLYNMILYLASRLKPTRRRRESWKYH